MCRLISITVFIFPSPYYRIKKSSSESNFIISIVQRDAPLKKLLYVAVKNWSPKIDSLFYQDKTFSVDVKSKDYLDKIAEQANMEVIISASVARDNNNKDNIVKVDNFRLRRADIEIKVSYSTKELCIVCNWVH